MSMKVSGANCGMAFADDLLHWGRASSNGRGDRSPPGVRGSLTSPSIDREWTVGASVAAEKSAVSRARPLDLAVAQDRILIVMRPSSQVPNLICDGALIGGAWIPPFGVRQGEIVKLVWDSVKFESQEQFLRAMCETGPGSPIRVAGRVIPVQLAMPSSRWREWLHRERAADWLARRMGTNRRAAESRLRQVGIDPEAALSCLPGTPRWILGLEYALTQSPAVIIFHTAGLDPMGAQNALAAVSSNIRESAGLYLAANADLRIEEPDYAAIHTIRPRERQAVA
jgi:hypothetical protein